ncbi:hypothetical protein H257_02669 [Aphanomyces astaci]|uniref:Uncharacterized protein n=1 Tax=Aphanomyces astaci TaxID=112090 RepID=W4H3S1_APHAT|nr:hypothetical protein H257_02669 [Aphanomyces astaci]ETV86241.1 hypothetical protein H257_02669 [Aphanomyces astaci]|eukprot:XP_009824713.1 hypothetical protein H257_02669 [Aphanomyces astaci]
MADENLDVWYRTITAAVQLAVARSMGQHDDVLVPSGSSTTLYRDKSVEEAPLEGPSMGIPSTLMHAI